MVLWYTDNMDAFSRISLFFLRIAMGSFLLYAGLTKVLDPSWSAAVYLGGTKTFQSFYQLLLAPNVLPAVNFLNEWGMTLLGLSLILGIFVRLSGIAGALLMVLYYFPILDFPYPNPPSDIVDEHIIYALAFLVLAASRAGRVWGLENWCVGLPICSRYPRFRSLLG